MIVKKTTNKLNGLSQQSHFLVTNVWSGWDSKGRAHLSSLFPCKPHGHFWSQSFGLWLQHQVQLNDGYPALPKQTKSCPPPCSLP